MFLYKGGSAGYSGLDPVKFDFNLAQSCCTELYGKCVLTCFSYFKVILKENVCPIFPLTALTLSKMEVSVSQVWVRLNLASIRRNPAVQNCTEDAFSSILK